MKNTFVLVAGVLLSACAGIQTENLVPDTTAMEVNRIDKSLSVLSVTGAQEERFGGPEMIQNDEFKAGLVSALQQAGVFQSVSPEPGGDLEMNAEFIAQGQGDKGLDYKSALVIEYWINERGGDEIWREAFNSRNEVTVGQALSGATRTRKAQEGSVRKNLAQLVESLAEWNYSN